LITLIISGEKCKLRSSSLCNFLQPPVISSLSGLILSSAPCSQTPSICVLWHKTRFHTHSKQEIQLQFCGFNFCIFRLQMGGLWTAWKLSPNLVCALFLHECNSNLLMLFPHILILPHFQKTYYLTLFFKPVTKSWHNTWKAFVFCDSVWQFEGWLQG
jgi:hypothetical protein